MSARRPGTTCIRCPECDVDWPCQAVTSLAAALLGVANVETHLQGLAGP
jgi:hypothetical protein